MLTFLGKIQPTLMGAQHCVSLVWVVMRKALATGTSWLCCDASLSVLRRTRMAHRAMESLRQCIHYWSIRQTWQRKEDWGHNVNSQDKDWVQITLSGRVGYFLTCSVCRVVKPGIVGDCTELILEVLCTAQQFRPCSANFLTFLSLCRPLSMPLLPPRRLLMDPAAR